MSLYRKPFGKNIREHSTEVKHVERLWATTTIKYKKMGKLNKIESKTWLNIEMNAKNNGFNSIVLTNLWQNSVFFDKMWIV